MNKEHPIIISTDLIPATLDGRKTQTRRVMKPQPRYNEGGYGKWMYCTKKADTSIKSFNEGNYQDICPHGQVGDRLWVRETWQYVGNLEENDYTICYKADKEFVDKVVLQLKWRSSRLMPRWASRITLKITGVRVERLQEITQRDAKAEGTGFWWKAGDGCKQVNSSTIFAPENVPEDKRNYITSFTILWDSLNAKRGYGWEINPWVWVISFRRL